MILKDFVLVVCNFKTTIVGELSGFQKKPLSIELDIGTTELSVVNSGPPFTKYEDLVNLLSLLVN